MKLNIFFALCIAVRLLFAFYISKLSGKQLQISSILGFTIAFGFILMILINRTRGGFGQKVWWGKYRIIHAALFLTFAVLALNKQKLSYVPLIIDALLGVLFFTHNRIKPLI